LIGIETRARNVITLNRSQKWGGKKMKKSLLLKRLITMIVYLGELLFVFYIGIGYFKSGAMFDVVDLFLIASIFCIPAGVATCLIASTMQEYDKKVRTVRAFVFAVFLFYALILFYLLFMGRYRLRAWTIGNVGFNINAFNINLVPFRTIATYIRQYFSGSINKSIIIENLMGNLFVFAPMGLLLPCLFKSLRKFNKFIIAMIIILVAVESAQLLTNTGSMDIDDIILNLAGAIIFFAVWKLHVLQQLLKKFYIVEM
jgi:glycopeptide antibiotics resistance protein